MINRFVAFAVTLAAAAACESSTEFESKLTYAASMSGAKEKPTATTSTATGQATLVLSSNGSFTYSVSWSGLTGAATMAHIHGPSDTSNTAGVLIDFSALPAGSTQPTPNDMTANGSSSGTVSVKGAITTTVSGDSLVALLNAGHLYVNVHTTANPAGEIRGQLRKQ